MHAAEYILPVAYEIESSLLVWVFPSVGMRLMSYVHHRRLQNCVGTRARLGYTTFAFDVQLRILSLHCTLYLRLCVRSHAYAI